MTFLDNSVCLTDDLFSDTLVNDEDLASNDPGNKDQQDKEKGEDRPASGESPESAQQQKVNKHILIVEDDKVSILYLKELIRLLDIEGLNLHADHVFTGEKAIDYCAAHPCDLILMDLKLPGMDGLETTRQIRKRKPFLPIIAQTAFALSGDDRKALDAGCNDYVSKPISENVLIEKLRNYLLPF
jgi:CheY-like chemotaxis protein